MKNEIVEILSDTSNQAVIRHPSRNYPGVLIQGDTLYSYCSIIDEISHHLKNNNLEDASEGVDELRNALRERLDNYKLALREHDIDLPFYENP